MRPRRRLPAVRHVGSCRGGPDPRAVPAALVGRAGSALVLAAALLAACGPALPLPDGDDPFRPVRDGGPPGGADGGRVVDGGAPDDGGPEPDAGPLGPGLGEACEVTGAPCQPGLTCLRDLEGNPGATCVVDCGVIEGTTLVEVPEVCGEYEACATLVDETGTQVLRAVCLPIQYGRDFACYAFEDPDVCALDRACAAAKVVPGPGGTTVIEELRCRDTCTYGAPDADAECYFGDLCLPDPITTAVVELELQNPQAPGSTIACDPEDCYQDDPACACSLDEGYRCVNSQGQDRCARTRGLCGTAAPYLDAEDPIGANAICNELNGSRFCDRRPYVDLGDDPAIPLCIGFADPAVEGDGICVGFCSQPTFDYDGNGQVDLLGGEAGFDLNCPKDQVCDRAFARSIGLVVTGVPTPCDPAVCPVGEPCGACPGGVECVDEFYLDGPTCAAVFGSCHPAPEGPPDGPDAGPSDAGPGLPDAGPPDGGPRDAGAGLDGGLGAPDGGPADAGSSGAADAG